MNIGSCSARKFVLKAFALGWALTAPMVAQAFTLQELPANQPCASGYTLVAGGTSERYCCAKKTDTGGGVVGNCGSGKEKWAIAIALNQAMSTSCGAAKNLPVDGAKDCPTAIAAAQKFLKTNYAACFGCTSISNIGSTCNPNGPNAGSKFQIQTCFDCAKAPPTAACNVMSNGILIVGFSNMTSAAACLANPNYTKDAICNNIKRNPGQFPPPKTYAYTITYGGKVIGSGECPTASAPAAAGWSGMGYANACPASGAVLTRAQVLSSFGGIYVVPSGPPGAMDAACEAKNSAGFKMATFTVGKCQFIAAGVGGNPKNRVSFLNATLTCSK